MAKILTWRDEWTLDIDTLDGEHRDMVNMLLEIAGRYGEEADGYEGSERAIGATGGIDEGLYAFLDRFSAFARHHFEREEEFLRTIDYPGLADHRSEHALLMAELTALLRELRQRGVERLGAQDLDSLKQWVVAHILGADRGFTNHYFKLCGGSTA